MGPSASDQELDEAIASLSRLPGPANSYGASMDPLEDTLEIQMVDPQSATAKEEGTRSKVFHLPNPFNKSRKTTKEGQPAKKRGPKPDSRPAATRRQELNRQAQRSHRERKENYTRAMENDLSRLRNIVVVAAQEAKIVHNENAQLKQLLEAHGIQFDYINQQSRELREEQPSYKSDISFDFSKPTSSRSDTGVRSPTNASGSQGMVTPSHTATSSQAFSPRSFGHEPSISPPPNLVGGPGYSTHASPVSFAGSGGGGGIGGGGRSNPSQSISPSETSWNPINQPRSFLGVGGAPLPNDASVPQPPVLDLDQIGIDFVLALESNCHDHISFRAAIAYSEDDDDDVGGHALMMTCPPADHLIKSPGVPYPHQMPPGPKEAIAGLINMSRRLPIGGGELTPAVAWQYVRQDERFQHLDQGDFETITIRLMEKCRCYGFGAVVEMYEVSDVLDDLFREKEIALRKYLKQAQQAAATQSRPEQTYQQSAIGGQRAAYGISGYTSPGTGSQPGIKTEPTGQYPSIGQGAGLPVPQFGGGIPF